MRQQDVDALDREIDALGHARTGRSPAAGDLLSQLADLGPVDWPERAVGARVLAGSRPYSDANCPPGRAKRARCRQAQMYGQARHRERRALRSAFRAAGEVARRSC